MKKNLTRRPGGGNGLGYALLAPATVLLLVMSVYPLLNGFWLSMTNRHLLKPKQNDFVFLDNYITLFQDKEFFGTLAFTFAYTFCVVAISYVAGLALALALNRNVPGRGFFRAVFLIPWVIPPVVAIINWSYILNDQFGIIKQQLSKLVQLLDASTRLLFAQNLTNAMTDDGNSLIEMLFDVFEKDLIDMLELSDATRKAIEGAK